MTVQDIIANKPYLAWYVTNTQDLSDEAVLENILNFGNWDDVQEFIKIKGIQESATIFDRTIQKGKSNNRTNYRPEIENYFKLYFDKYAQRNSK